MKRLIFIAAFLITAIIISCTTDTTNNYNDNENITLIPDVEWINRDGSREPIGIDSIIINISSPSMGSAMVKKFPYINSEGKKEGTISGVPIGIEINVTLTALDSTGNVIYSGTISTNTNDPDGSSMAIAIEATQVSPQSPSSLNANALSFNKINLIWADNSNNESSFIIERRLSDSTKPFLPIDTIESNKNNYTDINLQHSTIYVYRVIALNGTGLSLNYTNLDSAKTEFKDTLKPVLKISSHNNPDTVNSSTININGTVKDTSGIKEMFFNNLLIVPELGSWSIPNVSLLEGENKFLITVKDNSVFENTISETLTIIYDPLFIDTINDAPYFTISNTALEAEIHVGDNYKKTLKATDPDAGDEIHFTVSSGLILTEDTISWQPSISDTGENTFWALVTDADGESSDTLHWTITVLDTTSSLVNSKPVFITKASELPATANVGVEYSVTVEAKDNDIDDVLKYSKIQGPETMTIDGQTGDIRWTPDTSDTGAQFTVQIEAKDDSLGALLSWTINVNRIVAENNAPKFTKTAAELDREVLLGSIYNDSITVTDADSDANLTFSKITELTNFTFTGNGKTGIMSWNANIAGTHSILLKVTDQHGALDSIRYTITVPENKAPVIETDVENLKAEIYPGDTYAQAIKVSDSENHSIVFKEMEYPNGVIFRDNGNNTDSITWTPTIADIGTHTITIKVTDEFDSSAIISWNVTVLNRAPKFITDSASISGQTIYVGQNYSQQIQAEDPDNHTITYNLLEPNDNSLSMNGNIVNGVITEYMVKYKSIKVIVTDELGALDTLHWTLNTKFNPPVWQYDTVFVLPESNVKLPIQIPGRDTSGTLYGFVELASVNNGDFKLYQKNLPKLSPDTVITLTMPAVNQEDSLFYARALIYNQYGIDTSSSIIIKVVNFLDILNQRDSSSWSIDKDNIGSKITPTNENLITFDSNIKSNKLSGTITIVPMVNETPYLYIKFEENGNFSNINQLDISYNSSTDFAIFLLQSDIPLIGEGFMYHAFVGTKALSIPVNNNTFVKPNWIQATHTFDLSKVTGIMFCAIGGDISEGLVSDIEISKLNIHGYKVAQ